MTVFVDTSALYALLDEDDQYHVPAAAAFRSTAGHELATHSYVVVETLALVGARLGFDAIERLVDDLLPVVDVSTVDPVLHDKALGIFRAARTTAVSYVDRVSFAFMHDRSIGVAFAFDADFTSEGFSLLTA